MTFQKAKLNSIWVCNAIIMSFSFDLPDFLYQEYRDTSKQQEIEQRRQLESLSPGVKAGPVGTGSGVMSPPVLQLQLRNSACSLSLWQNLEAVQASGLLTQLLQKEIIMQEVRHFVRVRVIWKGMLFIAYCSQRVNMN